MDILPNISVSLHFSEATILIYTPIRILILQPKVELQNKMGMCHIMRLPRLLVLVLDHFYELLIHNLKSYAITPLRFFLNAEFEIIIFFSAYKHSKFKITPGVFFPKHRILVLIHFFPFFIALEGVFLCTHTCLVRHVIFI